MSKHCRLNSNCIFCCICVIQMLHFVLAFFCAVGEIFREGPSVRKEDSRVGFSGSHHPKMPDQTLWREKPVNITPLCCYTLHHLSLSQQHNDSKTNTCLISCSLLISPREVLEGGSLQNPKGSLLLNSGISFPTWPLMFCLLRWRWAKIDHTQLNKNFISSSFTFRENPALCV